MVHVFLKARTKSMGPGRALTLQLFHRTGTDGVWPSKLPEEDAVPGWSRITGLGRAYLGPSLGKTGLNLAGQAQGCIQAGFFLGLSGGALFFPGSRTLVRGCLSSAAQAFGRRH